MLNILKKINNEKVKGSILLSIVLTLCCLYGDLKVKCTELNVLYIVKYLLVLFIYYYAIKLISYLISNDKDLVIPIDIFNNIWILFAIILICWSPHIILKYPIAFWYDEYVEVLQGLGQQKLSTHFPIFYTYELTFFYNLFNNHNIGMFVFSILHALIMSIIFALVINTLYKMKLKKWMLILFTVFYAICPYVAGSMGTTTKDVYYSGYFVLFSLQLLNYYYDEGYFNDKRNILLLIISAVLITITRKNGIYVIVLSLIVFVIKECKRINKKTILLILLVPLLCALVNSSIENAPNAEKGNVVEMLSIPVQQTARLVKYHPELITSEEKEIINKVFPYDELPNLYNEDLADPVKFNSKIYTFSEEVIEYLQVWFKQFFRAPLTYIEATFRQNIYLLYPEKNIYKYNVECNAGYLNGADQSLGLVQTPLYIKNTLQPLYWSLLNVQHEWPIFRLINNMSVFVILFLMSVLIIANRNKKDKLLVYIPSIVTLVIVIASPTIRTHPRYLFPIIYSFPIWFGLLFIDKKESNQ